MEIKSYKDLDAWRVGMDLVEATYRFTANLPGGERFGLISQLRRAAISITSNVAEGHEQKILYGMRRERERRIGTAGISVLLILVTLSQWLA